MDGREIKIRECLALEQCDEVCCVDGMGVAVTWMLRSLNPPSHLPPLQNARADTEQGSAERLAVEVLIFWLKLDEWEGMGYMSYIVGSRVDLRGRRNGHGGDGFE